MSSKTAKKNTVQKKVKAASKPANNAKRKASPKKAQNRTIASKVVKKTPVAAVKKSPKTGTLVNSSKSVKAKAAAKKPVKKLAKKPVQKPVKKSAPKPAANKKTVSKRTPTPILKKAAAMKVLPKKAAKSAPKKAAQTHKKLRAQAAKRPAPKTAKGGALKKAQFVKTNPKKSGDKIQAAKKSQIKTSAKVSSKPAAKKPEKASAKTPQKNAAKIEQPKPDPTSKKTVSNSAVKTEILAVSKKVSKKSKSSKNDSPLSGLKIDDGERSAKHSSKRSKIRHSENIYFSVEDLDEFFSDRAKGVTLHESAVRREKAAAAKKSGGRASSAEEKVATPKQRKPEKFETASIADILGFNPVVAPTREKHEEKEIPRKWKKFYSILVEMRKRYATGVSERSEEVLKRSVKEDSGDLSSYGQHLADAGSESYDRDMAYSLLSSDQGMIGEIDAAIERMRKGTYGICEYTGAQIPESRLLSIPFTRYTKEGQERKEVEQRRALNAQRTNFSDLHTEVSGGEGGGDFA